MFVCVCGKQEAESPSQEVALLLHRKGFDCSSAPEPPLQCTWSAHEEVDTTNTHFKNDFIIINVAASYIRLLFLFKFS